MWNWRTQRARRARFEAELVPHLPALYRFACALEAADEAEDLVQITCARALERHTSYRLDTHVRAWLFTILRNELVSRRRRSARERSLASERALLEADATAESVELLLLDRRWSEEIRTALASIDERYRTPIYLKDVEGFRYVDIANVLHCPLGTVMSRLARGRTLLRALLLRQATERGFVRAERRSDSAPRKESM
jgi:RNA polymerase sigma-70 factor (ECF subfamily)